MFGPRAKDAKDNQNETHDNAIVASPAHKASENLKPTPSIGRRIAEPMGKSGSAHQRDQKRLIVGAGLSLAGEITSCDILVVEGKVEAKLTEGKLLEIAEAGQFRGSVEIENADIAGRYDGQLVVHGRLTVRSTGRISGMVKYGELEVSAGGQIIGEVQTVGGGAAAQQPSSQQGGQQGGAGFKSAARFAALTADDEQERKSA